MNPTTIGNASGGGGRDRVTAAIRLASANTGVQFGYLLNQARLESGLNPDARARTSSATGLFQFIDQTWLGTVRQHGGEHGLGWAASQIRQGPNGRFYVADPETRRQILDLRRQPEAASAMAAEYAADNGRYLETRLARQMEPVDLYLAHFLGAGGAARFLRAHDSSPDAPAAPMLPQAARANRPIFYNRDGSMRSFAEIRARFAERIESGNHGGGASAPAPVRARPPAPSFLDGSIRTASLDAGALPRLRGLDANPLDSTERTGMDADALSFAGLGLDTPNGIDPDTLLELGRDRSRPAGPSPRYARLAYLMLAQLGG
ncbi:MAG TPA: lytic transglycosylase domain-containing protein [Allosphingosinicella sp.]|nr:lytic transglycosylase domain-containing protein [Allosphingosinicella sp.]